MRTPTLTICALLTLPVTADARPIVWWHMADGTVDEIPVGQEELDEEEATVVHQKLVVARRDQQVDQRKQDKKDAKARRRDARKDLRTAKRELRQADRNGNAGMRDAIDRRAEAERDLDEANDYVALQKARIHQARESRNYAKSRLSQAVARREYTEAFLVSIHDVKGPDWTVPNRYYNQLDRIGDEVLDDERELTMARTEVREASQDHWSWDDARVLTTFYTVPTTPNIVSVRTSPPEPMELERLHFDLGSHHVKSTFKDDLAYNAAVLRASRDTIVQVEGHTDASGPQAFNLDLAWERAEAVAANLRQMGVWDSQIQTVAYGEAKPLIDTESPTAFNRRVELRVLETDTDALVDGTTDEFDPMDYERIESRYRDDNRN